MGILKYGLMVRVKNNMSYDFKSSPALKNLIATQFLTLLVKEIKKINRHLFGFFLRQIEYLPGGERSSTLVWIKLFSMNRKKCSVSNLE